MHEGRTAHDWEGASMRRLVDELPDLVCRFLPDGTLLYVNKAYAAFHGTTPTAMAGRRFLDFLAPDLRAAVARALAQMQDTTPENPIRRNTHQSADATGRVHWHEWTDRAFFDDDGVLLGFMSVGRDVTDALEQAARDQHDLVHDSLTGVLNRRGLLAALGDRLAHGTTPFAVGFIDLDRFKVRNDQLGHAAGDQALVRVASGLAAALGDGVVGRVGGDEFVVVHSGEQPIAALEAALHARLDLLVPGVTVSIGWAVAHPGETAEVVMDRADRDMLRRRADRRQRA